MSCFSVILEANTDNTLQFVTDNAPVKLDSKSQKLIKKTVN